MVATLVIGSAILLSIGIASLYLAKIYQEVKGRPSYIVRETDGQTAQNLPTQRTDSAVEQGTSTVLAHRR